MLMRNASRQRRYTLRQLERINYKLIERARQNLTGLPMNNVTRQGLAMALIGGAAITGVVGMPVWLALIGGAGLTFIAIIEHRKLRMRFAAVGSGSILANAQLASLVNGCITAIAAWAVGTLGRWLLQAMQ
jgi:hypothetical protein